MSDTKLDAAAAKATAQALVEAIDAFRAIPGAAYDRTGLLCDRLRIDAVGAVFRYDGTLSRERLDATCSHQHHGKFCELEKDHEGPHFSGDWPAADPVWTNVGRPS